MDLTLQGQSTKFIDGRFGNFKPTSDDVLLQLQEKLVACELLAQCVRLRRVELHFQVQSVRWADLDLLLDGLGGVEPVLDIVVVSKLEAEIILLDQIQSVEDLLVQIARNCFFLRRQRGETERKAISFTACK